MASVALTACGGPAPTQPTQDGCQVIGADPVAGSVLKAGVSINITVTERCSLTATANATSYLGGLMSPSGNPTPVASRDISKGTTTVSLTIPFIPPASETSVSFSMSIVYNVFGLPPTHTVNDSVNYTIR